MCWLVAPCEECSTECVSMSLCSSICTLLELPIMKSLVKQVVSPTDPLVKARSKLVLYWEWSPMKFLFACHCPPAALLSNLRAEDALSFQGHTHRVNQTHSEWTWGISFLWPIEQNKHWPCFCAQTGMRVFFKLRRYMEDIILSSCLTHRPLLCLNMACR